LSLKTDIDMVKEELTSEEKFFEKAVVTEKFIKKYKNTLIAVALVVMVGIVGNVIYTISENNRIEGANSALLLLQRNADDKVAQKELLKLSPALYDVWSYSKAISSNDIEKLKSLKSSKDSIVSNLASYEVASRQNDAKLLDEYVSKQDAIYKDLAQVQSAIILLQEKKVDLAHEKLRTINELSPLYKVAKILLHYGVK